MKLAVSVLLSFMFSASVFAAAPGKQFVGKYEHNGAGFDTGCMMDPSRVYVSLRKDVAGDDIIFIDAYSSENVFRELLLGSGKRVDPDSRNFNQTWTSEFITRNHFVSEVRTTGQSSGQPVDYVIKQELILKGDKLTYSVTEDDGDPETCVFDRVN